MAVTKDGRLLNKPRVCLPEQSGLSPKQKPNAATEGSAILGDMIAFFSRFVLFSESIFEAAKSIGKC
jgi:hypothetical protein